MSTTSGTSHGIADGAIKDGHSAHAIYLSRVTVSVASVTKQTFVGLFTLGITASKVDYVAYTLWPSSTVSVSMHLCLPLFLARASTMTIFMQSLMMIN